MEIGVGTGHESLRTCAEDALAARNEGAELARVGAVERVRVGADLLCRSARNVDGRRIHDYVGAEYLAQTLEECVVVKRWTLRTAVRRATAWRAAVRGTATWGAAERRAAARRA